MNTAGAAVEPTHVRVRTSCDQTDHTHGIPTVFHSLTSRGCFTMLWLVLAIPRRLVGTLDLRTTPNGSPGTNVSELFGEL